MRLVPSSMALSAFLLAGQARATDPNVNVQQVHEEEAHRVELALIVGRADVVRMALEKAPEVLVAKAPRAQAAEARRHANPFVVMPAQASVFAGTRWGSGSGAELT